MAERTSKLCSLSDAVKIIENGSRIGMGGFAVYQKPMAIVHEMIRANKNNLTIVGALNSIEVDMLAGAGCLKSVETSYVGLEKFGLAQNYRRAVEQGRIKAIHYPELLKIGRAHV
jgi:Acyl CoA:acetate/3-ketoacid CoA transferase, alpha subunit